MGARRKGQVMGRIAELFSSTPGARLKPVRGVYTALAIFLPLIALTLLGRSVFGALVMIGALLTAFGDIGISSWRQARALLLLAVGGALMTALGRLIGGQWGIEVLETFLVVFLTGLLAVYGRIARAVGILLAVSFVLSLSTHSGPATALPAAAGYLLGGAILILFALACTWLQPHQHMSVDAAASGTRAIPTTSTARLTWTSPLLYASLLRAAAAAGAAAIGWELGTPYPYWAALVVIICAGGDRTTSMMRTSQYVVATILGALLADIAIGIVHSTLVLGLILVMVTFLAFTVKDLNYALYVFFFTNLLLISTSIIAGGYSFAIWRVVSALIGAGLVFALMLLNQALLDEKAEMPV